MKQYKIHHGFTLIELLVVIAVISLLVSILLPSLQNAKMLAQGVACASNLKNIGMAIEMYRADYDDWYPLHYMSGKYLWPDGSPSSLWGAYISEYLGWDGNPATSDSYRRSSSGKVWDCPLGPVLPDTLNPEDDDNGESLFTWRNHHGWVWNSYGYNTRFGCHVVGADKWFRGDEVDRPSDKIIVGDSESEATDSRAVIDGKDHFSLSVPRYPLARRHLSAAPKGDPNIVFADGHVSTESYEEMHGIEYGINTDEWKEQCGLRYWFPNENWNVAKNP